MYCLNLPLVNFGRPWANLRFCSCIIKDWFTNKGKYPGLVFPVNGPLLYQVVGAAPRDIKRYQDTKAEFPGHYLLFLWNLAVFGHFLFQRIAVV